MKTFKLLFFLLSIIIAKNNSAQCDWENTVFQSGEKLVYTATYNLGFIWIDAGEAAFEVDNRVYNNKYCYYFSSYGKSLPSYDWIFKVRDNFVSFTDTATMSPLKFTRKSQQGDYKVDDKYYFDYQRKEIKCYTENSNKPYSVDTLRINGCIFDLLSAVYYARSIDYNKFKKNTKFPIKVVVDGEIHSLSIKYVGNEVIETRNNMKYDCIVLKPQLIPGTIFEEDEDMTIWISNDKNRIPIMVEAEVLVGSVKAILFSSEGLKYPLSAQLKN